jgi:hypothetical protein
MSEAKRTEYLCRLEIGAGHRKFGPIAPRKEPKDDDDGGSGSSELLPPSGRPHPLLGEAAQFSGDFNLENPITYENQEGRKELQYIYEAKLDKKLQQQKHINPTPTSR